MTCTIVDIQYEIVNVGMIDGVQSRELSIDDILYYSFSGNFSIISDENDFKINDMPLLRLYDLIRVGIQIIPIYATKVFFESYFREASTEMSIVDSELRISHMETSRALPSWDAAFCYVDFSSKFGKSAKSFMRDVEVYAPSLLADERVRAKLSDIATLNERSESLSLGPRLQ